MEQIEVQLRDTIKQVLNSLYGIDADEKQIQLSPTRKEFEGDITLVVFPFVRFSKKSPDDTANDIGSMLMDKGLINSFNVVKGFLNMLLGEAKLIDQFNKLSENELYGLTTATEQSPLVMIEYSSPNTNKPLHLGHIRNNLLGFSLAKIMEANGNRVVKTNIVNDRGIHICKSMLAWQKWGNGETPETTGMKGDHLIGKYYVIFDKEYKKELASLEAKGLSKDEAEKSSMLMAEAREMLRQWEAHNPEVYSLWETMNSWVYAGFDETYKALGVSFDKIYYESETYLVGRDKVLEGLETGVLYRREDGSVWADLTADGLDEKLLLRSDGTSVYMTQDIGTAKLRYDDFSIDKMIYVVGNEQNYHFQVLSILLDKLGFSWGRSLVHFSYGMVELPEGKMKSREGTVVDADDLVKEMVKTAREVSEELGKLEGYSVDEAENVYRIVALGALKYFILKVDPRKSMTFNPKESIDFNGNTGPFIQYTYARIQSVLRKAAENNITVPAVSDENIQLNDRESALIKRLTYFPQVVKSAGDNYSPAIIANYAYELVKEYNQFYHDCSILNETDSSIRGFRLLLSKSTGRIIRQAFEMLGIDVPERM
jgi:arginyl-tRNA synthetase